MMEHLIEISEYIIHLDKNLGIVIEAFGPWTYLILFTIVFLESGLFITPFLPGDPLLFVVGALSASGAIDLWLIIIVLTIASITGYIVNYQIGKLLGPKIFHKENVRFLNKKYLMRGNEFYERHGGKTIILARYIPIIRTFAPFFAGMAKMNYFRFMIYTITGAISWVIIFILGGYFLGNIPLVENNFILVMMFIIVISMLPGAITFISESRIKLSKDKV
ncbi:MAG: VTT domain-containing protein [Bacillota bacterium]